MTLLRKLALRFALNSYGRYWDFMAHSRNSSRQAVAFGKFAGDTGMEYEQLSEGEAGFVLQWCDPHGRVLDFGCGVGRIAQHVGPSVGEIVCADISRVMLWRARQTLAGVSNASFVRIGNRQLRPLDAVAPFDVVYALGVLHHLHKEDAVYCMAKFIDLLAPGGVFLVTLSNLLYPGNPEKMVRHSLDSGPVGVARVRYYTADELAELARAMGYDVEQISDFNDGTLLGAVLRKPQ